MGFFSGANTSALVNAVTAANTSITVGGTAKNPTLAAVMQVLFDQVLSTSAANFDATGLGQGYKNLRVVAKLRGTNAATSVAANYTFNGDVTASYDYGSIVLSNTGVTGSAQVSDTVMQFQGGPAATGGVGSFGQHDFCISSYADAFNKSVNGLTQMDFTPGTATGFRTSLAWGLWRELAALTQITLAPSVGSWDTGSRLTIYGF